MQITTYEISIIHIHVDHNHKQESKIKITKNVLTNETM